MDFISLVMPKMSTCPVGRNACLSGRQTSVDTHACSQSVSQSISQPANQPTIQPTDQQVIYLLVRFFFYSFIFCCSFDNACGYFEESGPWVYESDCVCSSRFLLHSVPIE